MKRFIKNTIFFFSIILLFFFMLNWILSKKNSDPLHYKLQYREATANKNNIDCIIIGTSHAAHGIRPSYLNSIGINFFNFSLNGSNPEYYYKWYNNIFSKYHSKPKYCIIAYDWGFFNTEAMWRRYEQDSEYFPFKVFLNNMVSSNYYQMKTLVYNIPVFKYKSLKDLKIVFNIKVEEIFKDYDDGFIAYEIPYDSNNFINPLTKDPFKCRTCADQKKYFEDLIKTLKLQGIRIIFVNIPEYGAIKSNYEKLEIMKYFNQIANINGYPILNYNIEKRSYVNENIKYFSDWAHLNSLGSREFSKMLQGDLKKYIETDAH